VERRTGHDEAKLRFLDSLGKAIGNLTEAGGILAAATRMLGQHLNATVCSYADVDADQNGVTVRGEWAAPGAPSILGHYKLTDYGDLTVRKLREGSPLVINDTAQDLPAENAAAFQRLGLGAVLSMPLVKEGQLTALMAVQDRRARVWSDDEIALLREVTERSWAHVERVKAELYLRESERRYRTLFNAIDEGFCIIEFFDGPHGPDSDYIHVEANPAYAVHTGIPNVVGQKVREMVGEEVKAGSISMPVCSIPVDPFASNASSRPPTAGSTSLHSVSNPRVVVRLRCSSRM
jgi:PAS domain-containing protein